jgi:hypothetical protein
MMERLVAVANFRSRIDAEAASGLLRGAKIPFVVRSGEGAGLGPLPGGTDLLVRREDAEEARQVLEDAGAITPGEDG